MLNELCYLSALVQTYQPPPWTLRSSTQDLLTVPCCRTVVSRRWFSVATPDVCNSLSNNTGTHTYACPFNGPFSGTTRVSQYQKRKTNLDFTEARDSEWQWHQLGHMQVCTSLQTDNYASTPPLSFLQAGCPSCRPTNSVKALKATTVTAALAK